MPFSTELPKDSDNPITTGKRMPPARAVKLGIAGANKKSVRTKP
ncbi:Uncharacterised protein [Chlamydia trachomatis]|nr:Uncharacterised protein [Chlamydia trachomatis]